jgi:cell division protein FtsA
MKKPPLISALDLGSEKIKIGVANYDRESKNLKILVLDQENSCGIRRGVVEDIEKLTKKILSLLERTEKTINKKINGVVINVGGNHLFVACSRGVIAVSRADQEISQEDIDRALTAAQALSLPSNKEVLEIFPIEFIIDNQGKIKNPLGMKGTRLEVEVLAICGFAPYLRNLTEAVTKAELDILEIIPSSLASAKAVLDSRQKELGVAVIDIGAWTSDLAVFEEGQLIHLAVIPIGSGHITSDIAIALQTEIDIAEKIKKEFGSCLYQKKGKGEKVNINPKEFLGEKKQEGEIDQEEFSFSKKFLVKVIEARITEIFEEVQREFKKIGKAKLLPAGVVLTGGGAKLKGIEKLAKRIFKLPVRVGKPKDTIGALREPSLATLYGLLLKSVEIQEEVFKNEKRGIIPRLKNIFRPFIP